MANNWLTVNSITPLLQNPAKPWSFNNPYTTIANIQFIMNNGTKYNNSLNMYKAYIYYSYTGQPGNSIIVGEVLLNAACKLMPDKSIQCPNYAFPAKQKSPFNSSFDLGQTVFIPMYPQYLGNTVGTWGFKYNGGNNLFNQLKANGVNSILLNVKLNFKVNKSAFLLDQNLTVKL